MQIRWYSVPPRRQFCDEFDLLPGDASQTYCPAGRGTGSPQIGSINFNYAAMTSLMDFVVLIEPSPNCPAERPASC